jgi:hypothetical protein
MDHVSTFWVEAPPITPWSMLGDMFCMFTQLNNLGIDTGFQRVMSFRCHPQNDFTYLFQRGQGDVDQRILQLFDSLMRLGTASDYFELRGFSRDVKLISRDGLKAFLLQLPNISTLHFQCMNLDTECCRLLGSMGHSPFNLCFTDCNLESQDAFGDGMRQNGGPTELQFSDDGSSDDSFVLGPLAMNTKLQSFILKDYLYLDEDRMVAILLSLLSAQGLRRIEFSPSREMGFAPGAWDIFWRLLSIHPSVTSVYFVGVGALCPVHIGALMLSNFLITTMHCFPMKWDDEVSGKKCWNEFVQPSLKRNRKLVHLNRVYRLVHVNPHLLAQGVWDVDRVDHSADRDAVFDNAAHEEEVET